MAFKSWFKLFVQPVVVIGFSECWRHRICVRLVFGGAVGALGLRLLRQLFFQICVRDSVAAGSQRSERVLKVAI
jgi:hypothetical protein